MENLKNNSIDMKTVVETYIIEETQELIYDNEKLDKWNEHVRMLGLTGQEQIVKKEKSPIPFLHMKISHENMFNILCPTKTEVEKYNISPIPLEILDLIGLSIKEGYFQKIQIWHDNKKPDPLCVGLVGKYEQSSYGSNLNNDIKNKKFDNEDDLIRAGCLKENVRFYETQKYLIGRWADVKASFEELKQMAKKRYVEEHSVKLRQEIKKSQRQLDELENNIEIRLNGDYVSSDDLPF